MTKHEQDFMDDELSLQSVDEPDPFGLVGKGPERHEMFKRILKNVLPYLGSDEGKIILAQVMIALKIEGVLGKELSGQDSKMVGVIKDSIIKEPHRKRQALRFARQLLRPGT